MKDVNVSTMHSGLSSTGNLDDIVREHLKTQNAIEYDLGDKLDNKMNISLVVITFLATQSGAMFTFTNMPHHWHILQIVSVVFVAVAGISAVWGLVPRNYQVGLSPTDFIKWVDQVKEFYGSETEAKSIEFINRKSTEQLNTRFLANHAVNLWKSRYVTCSYVLASLALGINLLTLVALTTGWRF